MWDNIVSLISRVYTFCYGLDNRCCTFWMKLTGHGRKSFLAFIIAIIYAWDFSSLWYIHPDSWKINLFFSLLILPLFLLQYHQYCKWLDDPGIGLDSVKVHNRYFNVGKVNSFIIVTALFACISIITIALIFVSPTIYMSDMMWKFLVITYFSSLSHSGPPQPDNTFWQHAKSKCKQLLENNRRPILQPLPVGN